MEVKQDAKMCIIERYETSEFNFKKRMVREDMIFIIKKRI